MLVPLILALAAATAPKALPPCHGPSPAPCVVKKSWTAEEVTARRAQGYSPAQVVSANPELKRAVDTLESGLFTPDNLADSTTVVDRLMSDGEHFLVLADYDSYAAAQDRVDALFRKPDEWSRQALTNALSMGTFSSDRSIREYADRIWGIKPVI